MPLLHTVNGRFQDVKYWLLLREILLRGFRIILL